MHVDNRSGEPDTGIAVPIPPRCLEMSFVYTVRFLLLAIGMLAGAAHADPVPESKLAYVGHWQGQDMDLRLH